MAGNRATPTQVAKELGIRPQIIYGLIKQKRIKGFGERPVMVDSDEVKMVVRTMGHREPKSAQVSRKANVKRGALLSYDKGTVGKNRRKLGHSVSVVTGVSRSEDEEGVDFARLDDGFKNHLFSTDNLGERLAKGEVKIESPEGLLGALIFHWNVEGQNELAGLLKGWCWENGIMAANIEATDGE